MEQEKFEKLRLIAFTNALKVTSNPEESEDIAQAVCVKFLQNIHKIENHYAWIKTVSRNEAYNYLKKQKKTIPLSVAQENMLVKTVADEPEMQDDMPTLEIDEVEELLSKTDFRTYKFYKKHNKDIAKIARSLKKTKSATYDHIYRMKRNLTASKFLKMQWRGTKKIISYNMQQNIVKFVKEFKKAIKKNDFTKMKHYAKNYKDFPKINAKLITKYYDYSILRQKDGNYRLCLAFKIEKYNALLIIFSFSPKINIISIKHISNDIIVVKKPKKEFMKNFKPLKNGLLQESKEEVDKIAFKNGGYIQK